MDFFTRVCAQFEKSYPLTASQLGVSSKDGGVLSPLLFSPIQVPLPTSLAKQAQAVVSAFHELRSLKDRTQRLERLEPPFKDPGNESILMSYDFHVDENGILRLIEINTNASASLITWILYATQNLKNPFSDHFPQLIVQSFKEEYRLATEGKSLSLSHVAIVDETPAQQRMYAEFLMYKELFEKSGLSAEICDPADLRFENDGLVGPARRKIDLVYNRLTDFYFESPKSRPLLETVARGSACITPHPHEFRLLADKARLIELGRPGALESLALSPESRKAIEQCLIRCAEPGDFASPDALWAERKKWFFKPKRSFGGKAAYRGGSMSRAVFAEILKGDYIMQEFVPAAKLPSDTANALEHTPAADTFSDFKYDLRFYAYQNRVQLAAARIYQGQMTNSQTPGGGLAAIDWRA